MNCDYISLHDLIRDGGGDDDEQGDVVLGPEDVEIFFKMLLTVWIKMTFCLEIRSGWRISKR